MCAADEEAIGAGADGTVACGIDEAELRGREGKAERACAAGSELHALDALQREVWGA